MAEQAHAVVEGEYMDSGVDTHDRISNMSVTDEQVERASVDGKGKHNLGDSVSPSPWGLAH